MTRYEKQPKTILLENGGLLSEQCEAWINLIDDQYVEVNSEVDTYMRSDDLQLFAMFTHPNLKTIATSSAFPTIMPYEAICLHGKKEKADKSFDFKFYQLEYFSWLIYESVGYRKKMGLEPLTIEINYKGNDFLKDLKGGDFGQDTTDYLKLMLRQSEGHIIINLYKDYTLTNTLKTEEDLNLND